MHGRAAVVFAQLEVTGESRGVHALYVPIRDDAGTPMPGVEIEDCGAKLGLDGVDNGRLSFTGVRVPREALLNRYADVNSDGTYFSEVEDAGRRFFLMLGTLVQGRVSVSGAAINATKVALTVAVRHALTRRQFGPPDREEVTLMTYRTHQRRLLPALAATYRLHFAQERLVATLHEVFTAPDGADERARRELEARAAGLKAIATWHATQTIQTCRECCGGAGYLRGNRFAALKADTDVFTTFEGDNTVLLQLTAKALLTGYKDHLGDLDPLGLASFFAGTVFDVLAERTAVRELLGRLHDEFVRDDRADLLDRHTQLDLFRWRGEHLVKSVARRLKGGMDAGHDPFDVLVHVQDHMLGAARAYVDLVVLEAFNDQVEACTDPGTKTVLGKLCSLHALSVIEAERGFFQEHGRLSSPLSKAVVKTVNGLCAELRDHAGDLVEAFGVPETALGDARQVPVPAI